MKDERGKVCGTPMLAAVAGALVCGTRRLAAVAGALVCGTPMLAAVAGGEIRVRISRASREGQKQPRLSRNVDTPNDSGRTIFEWKKGQRDINYKEKIRQNRGKAATAGKKCVRSAVKSCLEFRRELWERPPGGMI